MSVSTFGQVDVLTSAQIMFLAFAGMEDARIKAGNGTVERSNRGKNMAPMSVSDYAKTRRSSPEMKEFVKKTRAAQKDFRKWLESQVKAEFEKDMRFR